MVFRLEHTAEAGPLVREESSSETRISIEDEEANRLADAAEVSRNTAVGSWNLAALSVDSF